MYSTPLVLLPPARVSLENTSITGLDPNIRWSKTGRIQLNEEVTVTLTLDMDIGLFGGFGSFPITLRSEATGKSEVYWK